MVLCLPSHDSLESPLPLSVPSCVSLPLSAVFHVKYSPIPYIKPLKMICCSSEFVPRENGKDLRQSKNSTFEVNFITTVYQTLSIVSVTYVSEIIRFPLTIYRMELVAKELSFAWTNKLNHGIYYISYPQMNASLPFLGI